MLECLILGDSIAVGTHQFRPECAVYARSGITSHGWNKLFGNNSLAAETVIISLGTNDWKGANTYAKLHEIRTKITGKQVFWIAPNQTAKPLVYQDVNNIAGMFGDEVISTNRYQQDKIHPSWAGYKELVNKSRTKSGQ